VNTDVVLRFVRKHPGFTCEQLAAKLGESPALLSVVLRQLRKAGLLASDGNTRGTKWSAAAKKS
jgi:DNA-binding IscR family transcriptional regulator